MNKKIIAILLVVCMLTLALCSCTQNNKTGKYKVVTTIYPVYDWLKNIVGDNNDNVEVTLLNETGVDLHSYQGTASDIVKISNSDLLVYTGGESEGWVEDAVETTKNENRIVISLLDVLGDSAIEEELKEGMQESEHHHHDEEEHELDEHVWLSLKNASKFVKVLSEKICLIDAENKSLYETNTNAYLEKINALDKQFTDYLKTVENKVLVIGDRMPFIYLFTDYDIDYFAAFSGCSAETEASFETILFLSKKLVENNSKAIFKIEGSTDKVVKTIIETSKLSNVKILTLNSMQNVTLTDVKNKVSYLDMMENNLNVLKQAF